MIRLSAALILLQLLLFIHQTECQFRIPPVKTTVVAYATDEPQADSYSTQEVIVPNGQEFTIQVHLDQTPTEDDYDIFLYECAANGVPFMDNYGCAIRARSNGPIVMTREMHVIPKDDNRLAQSSYKNDKYTFLYLRSNGGAAGTSIRIICSIKYVDCHDMTCQRQPGCTTYMSSNTIQSVQTISMTALVRIEGGGEGIGHAGGDGDVFPNPGGPNTSDRSPITLDTANIAWWHIALICAVALLLLFVVVALLIALCRRKSANDASKSPLPPRPARNSTVRPDSRIYEEVYEPRHYYTPSENVSHATYAPTNVSQSRVALAAYNNNYRHA